MNAKKNVSASIRQRLLNIARETNADFQLVLNRFAVERFLYRLTQSRFKNDFVLKGAMLLQVWGGEMYRPTRDLDLLKFGKPDLDYSSNVIKEICSQDISNDGIVFQTDTIQLAPIKEDDEYHGIRATLFAALESARIPLQIDIAFGDVMYPESITMDYPTLLNLPAPKLRAYSQETVVAEKFHAMIHLGIANSRMKDFYDLWFLATTHEFEEIRLRRAVVATFERRNTPLPIEAPLIFTDEFRDDPAKVRQWNAFFRKLKFPVPTITLKEITSLLKKLIMPLFKSSEDNDGHLGLNRAFRLAG